MSTIKTVNCDDVFRLYVRVDILLACRKPLDDCSISLGEVWIQKHSLTLSLLIAMHATNKVSERSCICVLGCGFCLWK